MSSFELNQFKYPEYDLFFFTSRPENDEERSINDESNLETCGTVCTFEKLKKVGVKIAPGVVAITAGSILATIASSDSSIRLIGKDLIVAGLKGSVITNLPFGQSIIVAGPVFSIAMIISYLAKSNIAFDVFGGILSKMLTVKFKDAMKGQPFKEALQEGLPKMSTLKAILPQKIYDVLSKCFSNEQIEAEEEDDDDREWQTPSLLKRLLIVSTLAITAGGSYVIPELLKKPTSLISVYTVSALTKTITVGLRNLPVIPEVGVGAGIIAGAFLIDLFFKNIPIKVFAPVGLFGYELMGDTAQQGVLGKLVNRNWFKFECGENKGEKKEITAPHFVIRTATVSVGVLALIGSYVAHYKFAIQTSLLTTALNGSVATLFTKGFIGKIKPNKKAKKLIKELEKNLENNQLSDEEIKTLKTELKNKKQALKTEEVDRHIDNAISMVARGVLYGCSIAAAHFVDEYLETSVAVPATAALVAKVIASKEVKEATKFPFSDMCSRIRTRLCNWWNSPAEENEVYPSFPKGEEMYYLGDDNV